MLFGLLIAVYALLTILSSLALWLATGKADSPTEEVMQSPSVTVLKPLCGADDELELNLESFFVQDYPSYELVFGVQGDADPSIEVVDRLRKRHPEVRTRLVIHNGGRGLNPKVSNLRAMLEAGAHDVVVISDSNVRVRPNYISAMVACLSQPGVGLVTSPICGVDERTFGATLENLQLIGAVGGGVAISSLLGRTLVVGKSMMFRRSVLDRLGGLGAVANLLAEDYIIGRMFHQAGHRVVLCSQPIHNVVRSSNLEAFWRRQLRWALLRTRLKPLIYPFELLANPMALALILPLLGSGPFWPLFLGASLSMLRDGLQWLRLRGPRGLAAALPLSPLKDLILLLIWTAAPFVRHVSWRGNRLRISSGTWLYAQHPMGARGPVRCE